jgi:hypothetical protein
MTKILGFTPLHYGCEYFRESLLSIRDHVDKHYVCYSKNHSHGFQFDQPCPDTEEELRTIAEDVLGNKLIWETHKTFPNEPSHRFMVHKHTHGMDIALSLDSDEVLIENTIEEAIKHTLESKERIQGTGGFIHLFRSFDWAMYDEFKPFRLENLHVHNPIRGTGSNLGILHFGSAQKESVMRYKLRVYGHAWQVRKQYLDHIFYKWTPKKIEEITFLHPISDRIWERPVAFDKNTLPDYLKAHPNFHKELI